MIFQNKTVKMPFIVTILIFLLLFGCAHVQTLRENDRVILYSYNRLSSELEEFQKNFPNIITSHIIGETYEGRNIYVIRVTGNNSSVLRKPGLLAIFAEHSAEHDVTNLAIGLIMYLAENYGKDRRITDILNEQEVYIVPMMNPDGIEFDLSGKVKPFTWRKNRRPTGNDEYGVDLNRNWGRNWNISVTEKLEKNLSEKKSSYYAGEAPFSEKETQALRDFLFSHPNIKILVDYHSGGGGFMQGMILYPGPFLENEDLYYVNRYEEIAEVFAKKISDPSDKEAPFFVNKDRNVALTMRKYFPWYIRPFFPKNIPFPPGTSGEWAFGELQIMILGVEITRDNKFFKNLQESINELIENQARGFVFLLETISEDPYRNP